MLGIFEDPRQPDRIIKMVTVTDGYLAYASWLLMNQTRSPHFLKVYAIEMLDDHRALVTVERLDEGHNLDDDEVTHLGSILADWGTNGTDAPPLLCEATTILYEEFGQTWLPDLHSGNFMTRPSTGTTVINDPFYRRRTY